MSEKQYSAAMLVIGNEILSGRTKDKNVAYVGENLAAVGIVLSEVRVVPDIEARIIEAVDALRSTYDYVFTTGGIGPTHDDITAESIAKAFGVQLEENKQVMDALIAHYGGAEHITPPRAKMTLVPQGARLIENPVSGASGFVIENVHVMAGVPRIMQAMFDGVVADLQGGDPVLSVTVECTFYESQIAEGLTGLQDKYPDVDIGSYPKFKEGQPCVNVVLRSTNEKLLTQVEQELYKIIEDLKN